MNPCHSEARLHRAEESAPRRKPLHRLRPRNQEGLQTLNSKSMQPPPIIEEVTGSGFSIIPSVFSTAESKNLAKLISGSSLPRGRAGIRHALANPDVAAVARSPQLAEIASAILGGGATPFCAT